MDLPNIFKNFASGRPRFVRMTKLLPSVQSPVRCQWQAPTVDLSSQSLAKNRTCRDTVTCLLAHTGQYLPVFEMIRILYTRSGSIVILRPPKRQHSKMRSMILDGPTKTDKAKTCFCVSTRVPVPKQLCNGRWSSDEDDRQRYTTPTKHSLSSGLRLPLHSHLSRHIASCLERMTKSWCSDSQFPEVMPLLCWPQRMWPLFGFAAELASRLLTPATSGLDSFSTQFNWYTSVASDWTRMKEQHPRGLIGARGPSRQLASFPGCIFPWSKEHSIFFPPTNR